MPRTTSVLQSCAKTWGLMYEGCVRTNMWRTSFSTLTFRCMKREMTVEMCGAPHQLYGWRTHVSTAIVPLATLRGDAGKLLIMSKTISHHSDVHVRDTLMNN